jgi:hypothetical protein
MTPHRPPPQVSFDILTTEKGPTAANVSQEDGSAFKRQRFDAGQGGQQRMPRSPRKESAEQH